VAIVQEVEIWVHTYLPTENQGLKQVQQVPSIEPLKLLCLYYPWCSLGEAIGPSIEAWASKQTGRNGNSAESSGQYDKYPTSNWIRI